MIETGKTHRYANFGYTAKIGFAIKGINGVESKWLAAKTQ
ncbi:hypothetical protein SAMN04487958_11927 [Vreelandella subterranea]|uniref:Uncharacterized protein n=1 Tax=Vreelandella subterranea TaxID=416874 RepID=A0A1H9WQQ7_9GAMM|nr:hypothetical protein SAMN04487958_11927 [Halomonas subterranea]